MTGGPEPISDVDRAALERKLTELRADRAQVAATLSGGEEPGDRADQADELQRADRLARLDDQITEITGRLREADLAGPPKTDTIGVGSTVTVRFADGTEDTVEVGELAEALNTSLVTSDSPLGQALLGRRAGDTVDYQAPDGPTTAHVVSVGGAGGKS
ncbi:GreA/GreB family elongation factor [Kitasatospora sp. NPDC097643]|uniref:GreA/GreB family elongation factor n=1 Tax=Kitasatospora sp. NPDC097643 TaxID=3157230 RepID=UPI00331B2B9D